MGDVHMTQMEILNVYASPVIVEKNANVSYKQIVLFLILFKWQLKPSVIYFCYFSQILTFQTRPKNVKNVNKIDLRKSDRKA